MESTPQNQKSTILIEGYLKFENEGMISSFSEYWMQVIEIEDSVSEGQKILFRILRNNKETKAVHGQSGPLPEDMIKRSIIIVNTIEFDQLPDSIQIVPEQAKRFKKGTDFLMLVNGTTKFNFRASSEAERKKWIDIFSQFAGPLMTTEGNESSPIRNQAGAIAAVPSQSSNVSEIVGEDIFVNYKDYGLAEPIIKDQEMIRISMPGKGLVRMNAKALWKILKEMVGKDLSKSPMPVWVNEPLSILQRQAEFQFTNQLLSQASKEETSQRRMLYVAAKIIAHFWVIPKRTVKPFNPLLGETYELVTPNLRFFSEQVSHHPPIMACSCEGEGYEYKRCQWTVQQFNGKTIKAYDKNQGNLTLYTGDKDNKTAEHYKFKEPNIVVGNLFIGQRFVEPQGNSIITCEESGDIADINFKTRGWTKNEETENYVSAKIKDFNGTEHFSIEGKYTEKLIAKDLKSGKEWVIFECEKKPEDNERMFFWNLGSLQLNVLTDDLKKKLPPSDCRLRNDIRAWDQSHINQAEVQKKRLEVNQRERRAKVKVMLEADPEKQKYWEIKDERTFYKPRYFDKLITQDPKGNNCYWYEPKLAQGADKEIPGQLKNYEYWQQRDSGKWLAPRLFEDDCEPWY